MLKYIAVFFLAIGQFASIQGNDKSKMLQDLDIIKSIFEAKYAPYEWKKDYFGWDLETQIAIAKSKVLSLNSLTVKDYQKILHTFFISMHDYHVHERFFSTEMSLLPFSVQNVEGKYFFTEVDTALLRELQIHGLYEGKEIPAIGNQLVALNAQAIEDVIEDLKYLELGNPTSRTSQALAEPLLTKRIGSLGHTIPQGRIRLHFINNRQELVEGEIDWLHIPERIQNRSYHSAMATFGKLPDISSPKKNTSTVVEHLKENSRLMLSPLADALQKDYLSVYKSHFDKTYGTNVKDEDSEDEMKPHQRPKRAIKRDAILFGQKLWTESPRSNFKAHMYALPNSNKRIGYIRLDTFYPSTDIEAINLLVMRLAKSIRYLETHSDALVIDQVDNPGGYFLYAVALLSMMTDRPLIIPKDRIAITQEDVAEALTELDAIEEQMEVIKGEGILNELDESFLLFDPSSYLLGFPLDQHFFEARLNNVRFVVDQWNSGKTLTDAFPIYGLEHVNPHPLASYSKPILVLVNSRDFSCGDFFPAILQDNRRAVIFGEPTAGAGGAVKQHTYPNSLGIQGFTYTCTITERTNGFPIENLGVTPDVPYNLTEEDLLHGYEGYINAVNNTLRKMLHD